MNETDEKQPLAVGDHVRFQAVYGVPAPLAWRYGTVASVEHSGLSQQHVYSIELTEWVNFAGIRIERLRLLECEVDAGYIERVGGYERKWPVLKCVNGVARERMSSAAGTDLDVMRVMTPAKATTEGGGEA